MFTGQYCMSDTIVGPRNTSLNQKNVILALVGPAVW